MKCDEWTLPGQGGIDLFARSWIPSGKTRDVVVISHGYGEHGGRYGNVVEPLLEAGFAVHALDHRGHGRSGGARAVIDRLEWVSADFHAFVTQVRAAHNGSQVKLLGHSMGGAIAFHYALDYQPDLSGLVLSAAAIGGAVSRIQIMIVGLIATLAPRAGLFSANAQRVSRDPDVVKAYKQDLLVYRGKVPSRTVYEMARRANGTVAQAPRITIPTLVQHGDADRLVPATANAHVYEALGAPDKTILIYPGLFHEIYNEPERDAVIADLLAWLEGHP